MEGKRVNLHDTESFMSLDEFDSDNNASYTAENASDHTKQDNLSSTAAARNSAESSMLLEPPGNTPISYLSHSNSPKSFAPLEAAEEVGAAQREEQAPALQRVGTPVEPQPRLAVTTHRVRLDGDLWARVVDEWPDLLKQEFTSDVCDATALPRTSMQRLVLTAGSLVADFQLSHGGLAKRELNKQLASSPFTRTWALYERVAETKETPPTRATPPAALRASESFAPLEAAEEVGAAQREEQAPALQRVGTPVEPQPRLAVTTHRVRLDGDLWARVVDEWPDLLKQEFTSDVCDATALPRTSMQRLVLTAGSLVADFQLSHGGLAKRELNKQLASSPFTRTWALYERVAETKETPPTRATPPAALRASESFASLEAAEEASVLRAQQEEQAPALQRVGTPVEPQSRLAVTTHRVRLDGDLWARVVDEWPDLLKQEFTSDVCDATALPRTSMQRLVLTAGSLVADFQLSHGGLAKRELNKQLASSPFTRTWALYERVAETKETPPTRATPPAALRASESFAPLEAAEEVGAAQREEQAPALQRVGTPVEPQPRLAVTTHRVRLDGDLWARVVDEWPDLLKQEFTSDVCDATALPRTSMQRLVLTAGSLVADFQLSHGGLAKRELNKQLASSPFTRTWALYERVAETKETPPTRATPPAALRASESFASLEAAEEASVLRAQQEEQAPALQRVGTPVEPQPRLAVTTHRVRLDGDLWARVVDEWPDLLKQEFTSDVCDATALPRTSMQRLVLTAGSLVADFQLSHGGLAKRELNKQLASSPFTRTWALYERVAETKKTPPTRATPPAALRASESFAPLEAAEEASVLRAQQEEQAPALQRVGTPVEPQSRLAVTTHRVRLDGDLWARVVDEWPDLLKQEFTSDVCDATALPRTSMQRLVLTAGSLVADFQLSHGGLAKRELNKQLASSPFTRTWALYERVAETKETPPTRATPPAALRASESFASLEAAEEASVLRAQQEKQAPALQRVGTPVEPQPRLAVTTHRVRLDGDLWARVVDEWPDLLKQEFTSDVCDATALPRTSMQRLVLTAGSLVADFQLSHGGLAKRELNKQLASSPFTRTWALYERVAETKETPPTRATPPAALRASESFAPLEAAEEVGAAQREEQAPALQRVGTPVEPQPRLAVTTHRVRLDGDLWARVVDEWPDLLKQEFTSDVCDATALPRTSMQRLVLTAGSLVADFQLSHGGLAKRELNKQLASSPFTRTWALYERVAETKETPPTRATPPAALRASESFAPLEAAEEASVLRAQQEEQAPALQRVGTPVEPQSRLAVTTHRVRLDGDLWARVVDEWPDLLKQEFTSDVCDATALPRTSMQRLVLTAGSLVADFQLSHGGLAKRELNKQLASSPFTRTWALYERVAETKETPPTRATPPAALRASESFASLEAAEEASVMRAQQEEQAPALQRVGTPVEPHRGALEGASPVDARTATPPAALRASESVASLEAAEEAAVLRAQQEEEPPVEAMTAFEEHAPALQRVGTPVEPHRGALEGASPVDARTATPPAALRASESFASLDPVEEAAVLRAQQEEEPPVEAMTAFEEHAPALQRVGTPVEPHRGALEGASPVDARTATPPAALRASESFASLDPVEEAAVLRAQQEEEPPVEAMTAFEEHAPALQRVGTPVEPHRGALEGASPVDARTATPPAALRASESFASLDPVEEAAVLRAQQEEEPPVEAMTAFEEHAPALQRVGTPVEPHRGALEGASPVDARTATPPAALRASESFASLDPVEEAAVLRAQQEEEPPVEAMTAFEEYAPALQRVGTPVEPQPRLAVTTHRVRLDGDLWARVVDEWPDLLKQEFTSDVCDATALPRTSMQRLVLTAGSLVADFQLSHGGLAKRELNKQLASSPFTRTWALYERVAETKETPPTRATPPAALRASESFASLDPVEEAAVLRAQQEEEPPVEAMTAFEEHAPALQRVGTPVEPHRGALEGASPVDARTATPPAALRASESFASLDPVEEAAVLRAQQEEEPPVEAMTAFEEHAPALQRVGTPVEPHRGALEGASPVDARTATPPAALRASESFASLDPVEEAAVLRAQQEEEPPVEAMTAFEEYAPALQRVGTPVEPQPRLAVTTHRVRLDGDLWARVVDEWPDLLKQEFTSDVCDATALPRTSMQRLVLTAGSLVADFQLSHGGLAKRELDKQLASSPFTRTWALYERVAETKETPPTRATPPAALRASESFASLERRRRPQ
ncbi:Flagellar Member 8 [Leishmania donovani]|uniref:Flagellar Member 8 n=1 Tax=Leishmania donovani TaxID=5661 RepID=A0A3Q8IH47_LEIDO|nr:Flagellar Member 8 [Leishmania donovani]